MNPRILASNSTSRKVTVVTGRHAVDNGREEIVDEENDVSLQMGDLLPDKARCKRYNVGSGDLFRFRITVEAIK